LTEPCRLVFLLSMHHICADGWSMDLLAAELSRLYAARLFSRPHGLAALRAQCFQHAELQARWLAGPAAARQREWWRHYLSGTTPRAFLPLSSDSSRWPATPISLRVRRQIRAFPEGMLEKVSDFARLRGASLYMTLLSAFVTLLARWGNTSEVIVGALAANRPSTESSHILGAHYNTILVRVPLGGDPSLEEILARAIESSLAALDHQQIPFEEIATLASGCGVSPDEIPGVMLLLDTYPLASLALEGARGARLNLDWRKTRDTPGTGTDRVAAAEIEAASPAGLTFFLRAYRGRFLLSMLHRPDRVSEATVLLLGKDFQRILSTLVVDPTRKVGELMLSAPSSDDTEADPFLEGPGDNLAPVDALSPITSRPWR